MTKEKKGEKPIISPEKYNEILDLLKSFKKEKHDKDTYKALAKADDLIADAVSILASIINKQSEKLKSEDEKEFIQNLSDFVMHYMAGNNVTKKIHEESLQVCYSKIELYEDALDKLQKLLLSDEGFTSILMQSFVNFVRVTDEGVDVGDNESVYNVLTTIFNDSNKLKECFTLEDLAQRYNNKEERKETK